MRSAEKRRKEGALIQAKPKFHHVTEKISRTREEGGIRIRYIYKEKKESLINTHHDELKRSCGKKGSCRLKPHLLL